MAKILVLGADGMVGHIARVRLEELGHQVRSVATTETDVWDRLDARDLSCVRAYLAAGEFDVVVNCIGILIKEAAADPVQAIRVNALLPQFLGNISRELGFRLIHASTDCVFSGSCGPYDENASRDADDVYGRTKALGEVVNEHDLTIRTSKIGPELKAEGSGLFNWFMKQKGIIRGYGKAIWGGVTTLEYANVIDWVISNPLSGLIHLTNGQGISKYDLLALIGEIWGKTDVQIIRDDSHVSDRSLVSIRKDFDYVVPSYHDMLVHLKVFMDRHADLYGLYA